MKTILFSIIILCITTISNADILQISKSCYPKELQKQFASKGYKLDINGNDRDTKSWGFLNNKGQEYEIITYNPVTPKELEDIMRLVNQ